MTKQRPQSRFTESESIHPIPRLEGLHASRKDALRLMRWSSVEEFYSLCSAAAQVRAKSFGMGVFVYGFAYFSTYCRNTCRFCFYRKQNTSCQRYRKDPERISEIAQLLDRSGVHLIDLTSGDLPIHIRSIALDRCRN